MSHPAESEPAPADVITVVGIGADGWGGLTDRARSVVAAADVVVGGERHLQMVPETGVTKLSWPRPFRSGLSAMFDELRGRRVVVLASGDPLVSGVGSTLIEMLGSDAVRIIPTVSSVALARARLGWPAEQCAVVTVVGRSVHRLARELAPGRRVVVLSSDAHSPAAVAELLVARGYGASRMTVLENLGRDDEHRVAGVAGAWSQPPGAALNVVAVECVIGPDAALLSHAPGLPDEAFDNDGQLTKRDLRASALARLLPAPGQLLWDIGAGSGSVAIEWMRVHPANRAVAIEPDPNRVARIVHNAERLGVPDLLVVEGMAPDVVDRLEPPWSHPDAVFAGGGVSRAGVLESGFAALSLGGRMVAHAVTLEAETALAQSYAAHGGELIRHALERASPLGGFTGWQPARTVTQWSITKEHE